MAEFEPIKNPGMIVPMSKKNSKDKIEDQKFEEALAKQRAHLKTDTDQKNQRKQEQEETEGVKKVVHEDLEKAKKDKKSSIYDISHPPKKQTPSLPIKQAPLSKAPAVVKTPQEIVPQEESDFVLNLQETTPLLDESTATPIKKELPQEDPIKEEKKPTKENVISVPVQEFSAPLKSKIIPKQEQNIPLDREQHPSALQAEQKKEPNKEPLPPPLQEKPTKILSTEKEPPSIELSIEAPLEQKLQEQQEIEPSPEIVDLPGLVEDDLTDTHPLQKKPKKEPSLIPPRQTNPLAEAEVLKTALAPPPLIKATKGESKKEEKVEEESSFQESSGIKTTVSESKELQKDKEEEDDEEESIPSTTPSSIQSLFPPFIYMDGIKLPSYTKLSPEVFALFEQLSWVITIRETLQEKLEKTQTSFILDGPQFSSSIFYGSQITIEEFASAPKEYNIYFSGSQEARDLFDAHKAELEDAFHTGGFSFTVQIIQTDPQE